MIKIAIILSIIHILYYIYVGIIYRFMKIGTIYNTPHEEIFKLRSKYGVKIKTFRKENFHWGFTWGKTIYLNERLLKVKHNNYRALQGIFHHEYYHLKHHTYQNIILRILLSITPMLLLVHWAVFAISYILIGYMVYWFVNVVFEKEANDYASKMMER